MESIKLWGLVGGSDLAGVEGRETCERERDSDRSMDWMGPTTVELRQFCANLQCGSMGKPVSHGQERWDESRAWRRATMGMCWAQFVFQLAICCWFSCDRDFCVPSVWKQ